MNCPSQLSMVGQVYNDMVLTNFTSWSGNTAATIMRHGAGKVGSARVDTKLFKCEHTTWAYGKEC